MPFYFLYKLFLYLYIMDNTEIFKKIIKIKQDYLLLKRVLYKTKSQFRRQKQCQMVNKLIKLLKKNLFHNKIEKVDNKYKYVYYFDKEDLKYTYDILMNLGETLRRMIKIKLYPVYSLIVLGIVSRIFILLKEINN